MLNVAQFGRAHNIGYANNYGVVGSNPTVQHLYKLKAEKATAGDNKINNNERNEMNIITPPTELFDFCKKRILFHKHLVRDNMMRFAFTKDEHGTTFNKNIEERAFAHDNSKLEKPELPGFVWSSIYYYLKHTGKGDGISYTVDPAKLVDMLYMAFKFRGISREELISQFTKQWQTTLQHHYANNSHHPEYYKNIVDMSEHDMMEMVCDWCAVAIEMGDNNGSAKAWADKVVGSRFKFSPEQASYIYALISELDEMRKHPIFVCTRKDMEPWNIGYPEEIKAITGGEDG